MADTDLLVARGPHVTDFLTRLASRALGQTPTLEPLIDSWRAAGDESAWPDLPLPRAFGAADEGLPPPAAFAPPNTRRAHPLAPATLEGPPAGAVVDLEPRHTLARATDTAALAHEDVAHEDIPPRSRPGRATSVRRATTRLAALDSSAPDAAQQSPSPENGERRATVRARVRTVEPQPAPEPTAPQAPSRFRTGRSQPAPAVPLERIDPSQRIAQGSASLPPRAATPPQAAVALEQTALEPPQPPTRAPSAANDSTAAPGFELMPHQPHQPPRLAESRRLAPTPRTRRTAEPAIEPQTITVTIGRIEVRAAPPTPAAPAPVPVPNRAPRLSLDNYLAQRNGAHR